MHISYSIFLNVVKRQAAVAQKVARHIGSVEVTGSIPVGSSESGNPLFIRVSALFLCFFSPRSEYQNMP